MDDDYSIKVADFGLTRDIYATEYYKSTKLTRLPVKWMSPESLLDNFFNEKTDVVRIDVVRTDVVFIVLHSDYLLAIVLNIL